MLEALTRNLYTSQARHRPMPYNEFGYQQKYNCVHDTIVPEHRCPMCCADMADRMNRTGHYALGPGNLMSNQYDLDDKWELQERFDFSGHHDSGPHVNYELVNPTGSVAKRLNPCLGKNDHHAMNLFEK